MPRGDGTGPRGMGSMTGRAAGLCVGAGMAGFENPVPGRGFGRGGGQGRGSGGQGKRGGGNGGGRGWRNMFNATGLPGWMRLGGQAVANQVPAPAMEKRILQNQAEALQSQLDLIQQRMAGLETDSPAK